MHYSLRTQSHCWGVDIRKERRIAYRRMAALRKSGFYNCLVYVPQTYRDCMLPF